MSAILRLEIHQLFTLFITKSVVLSYLKSNMADPWNPGFRRCRFSNNSFIIIGGCQALLIFDWRMSKFDVYINNRFTIIVTSVQSHQTITWSTLLIHNQLSFINLVNSRGITITRSRYSSQYISSYICIIIILAHCGKLIFELFENMFILKI